MIRSIWNTSVEQGTAGSTERVCSKAKTLSPGSVAPDTTFTGLFCLQKIPTFHTFFLLLYLPIIWLSPNSHDLNPRIYNRQCVSCLWMRNHLSASTFERFKDVESTIKQFNSSDRVVTIQGQPHLTVPIKASMVSRPLPCSPSCTLFCFNRNRWLQCQLSRTPRGQGHAHFSKSRNLSSGWRDLTLHVWPHLPVMSLFYMLLHPQCT